MAVAVDLNTEFSDASRAVNQSYGRIVTKNCLIARFYEIFIRSSAHVAAKFTNTNFEHQYQVLDQSLTMSLLFAEGNMIASRAMDRIRESHNRHHLNIAPEYYDLWLDSLIKAISEIDPEFTPQLESQWRLVMSRAIEYIRGGY